MTMIRKQRSYVFGIVFAACCQLRHHQVRGQQLSYDVNCIDSSMDQIIVQFDGLTPSSTVPWIGLYIESSLTDLPDLPTTDEGNLLDWQYVCGGRSSAACTAATTSQSTQSGSVTLDVPSTISPTTTLQVVLSLDDWSAAAQTGVFSSQSECGSDGNVNDNNVVDEGRIDSEPQPDPQPEEDQPQPTSTSGGQCNPRSSERRRRPWRTMSCTEQDEFLQAVQRLYDVGVYQEFIQVHVDMNDMVHRTEEFLPWHRWFLYSFETALQEVTGNCQITVPYWDWERDAGDEGAADVFSEQNFGQFECDHSAGWSNPCSDRTMGGDSGGAGGRSFAGEAELLTLISRDPSFEEFAVALEGRPHSVVHWFVGGLMSNRRSPTDPLFYLHHAAVDRLWTMHQDYHDHDVEIENGNYLGTHYNGDQNLRLPYAGGGTRIDFSWNGDNSNEYPTPRQLLNNIDMRVRYIDDNLAGILQRDGYSANGRLFEVGDNSSGGCGRRSQRERNMVSGRLRSRNTNGVLSKRPPFNGGLHDALNFATTLSPGSSLPEEEIYDGSMALPPFCVGPTPEFTLEKDRRRWNDYCTLLADPDTAIKINITSASDLFAALAERDCEDIAEESGEPNFDIDFLNLLESRGWIHGFRPGDTQAYTCPHRRF